MTTKAIRCGRITLSGAAANAVISPSIMPAPSGRKGKADVFLRAGNRRARREHRPHERGPLASLHARDLADQDGSEGRTRREGGAGDRFPAYGFREAGRASQL